MQDHCSYNDYPEDLISAMTIKVIQLIKTKDTSLIDNKTLMSLFKSYKKVRYAEHNIFEVLTEELIRRIRN